MKNFMKKASGAAKIAALSAVLLFCLTRTEAVSAAVYSAVERCLNVVIPSLFAMLIVSGLIVRSGVNGAAPRFVGRIGERLLGMEDFVLPIFTFGMFAGYPVGAKLICAEHEEGRIEKGRAELLCGLCFGAGPAFIFGCIANRIYSSPNAGLLILVSNIAANLIPAAVFSPFLRRGLPPRSSRRSFALTADMLTRSVTDAGKAMLNICLMITAFSVLTAMLTGIGLTEAAGRLISAALHTDAQTSQTIFRCILDVTAAQELPTGDYSLLPLISALTSFGGLCVMLQIAAVTSGKLSIKPLILIRLAAAVISYFICRAGLPLVLRGEAVMVAAVNVRTHSEGSAVPSVMIILMTAVLLLESAEQRPRRQHRR